MSCFNLIFIIEVSKGNLMLSSTSFNLWCIKWDLNPHFSRNQLLRLACLPIPPLIHILWVFYSYPQGGYKMQMVSLVGLEPTRYYYQGIFLLLYVAIATFKMCCSLDYVFTLSFDLGKWYIVSTHLQLSLT